MDAEAISPNYCREECLTDTIETAFAQEHSRIKRRGLLHEEEIDKNKIHSAIGKTLAEPR